MKPYSLFFLLAIVFTACAGPSSEKEAVADSTQKAPAAVSSTPTDISTYVGDIDEKAGSDYCLLTLHDFLNGENSNGAVAIFNNSGQPLRLYLYPEGDQRIKAPQTWIYLDSLSGKPVMLREIVESENNVTENSFYYGNDSVLQTETRAAADLASLEKAAFTGYQSPAAPSDYRLQPAEVAKLVEKVLAAVKADRKDLSKAANIVRKDGASHWGAGNEPGWSIAVIPHKKIVLHMNYDRDKYEFPISDAQKGDQEATEFSTNIKGHTLTAKFENKRCTDDADIKHPMTVTILFDGKTYQGCGQSLF
ncbi:hypothetical protein GFS24_22145 [Chitinophaga sp. SYP-B3965]|uniref:hypothetical protein n=1 Tax=Chitinophaga sp. SYP-B3965 TaxID=2663120 RepID=UPI001299936C|nr:hypothetical protein [Chitinophaga sp. SYP-B3965]MRG47840.1 hypothetical protein [Chitinophaga sp. SYP-B3965]